MSFQLIFTQVLKAAGAACLPVAKCVSDKLLNKTHQTNVPSAPGVPTVSVTASCFVIRRSSRVRRTCQQSFRFINSLTTNTSQPLANSQSDQFPTSVPLWSEAVRDGFAVSHQSFRTAGLDVDGEPAVSLDWRNRFDETHREPSTEIRTAFLRGKRVGLFRRVTLRADALTRSGISRQESETIRLQRFCG